MSNVFRASHERIYSRSSIRLYNDQIKILDWIWCNCTIAKILNCIKTSALSVQPDTRMTSLLPWQFRWLYQRRPIHFQKQTACIHPRLNKSQTVLSHVATRRPISFQLFNRNIVLRLYQTKPAEEPRRFLSLWIRKHPVSKFLLILNCFITCSVMFSYISPIVLSRQLAQATLKRQCQKQSQKMNLESAIQLATTPITLNTWLTGVSKKYNLSKMCASWRIQYVFTEPQRFRNAVRMIERAKHWYQAHSKLSSTSISTICFSLLF